MIASDWSGRRRGTPPVASRSFWKRYTVPRSSVAVRPRGSIATTRRPNVSSAPVAAVLRQMLSSGSPFHRALESGGRLYGGSGSAPMSAIVPLASTSRIPRPAASAVIPAPTMRYVYSRLTVLRSLALRERPPMLLLPTILLHGPMHLMGRGLQPLLHGRLGIRHPDGELVFLRAAHGAKRARICFA